ncbi:MAG: type IV secretion system protein [Legionellaceae bacterium]|nr:type IV secretion system protein [Legionellaceae bacterium]
MKAAALGIALLLGSSMVYADALGVGDAALLANAIEQFKELQKHTESMKSAYNKARDQLDTAKKLKALHEGHYGLGDLKNTAADLKNRQWSPETWEDALQNLAGGNKARYNALVKAYEKNNDFLSDDEFSKGASQAHVKQYKKKRAVNEAVTVQTTYAFDELSKHIKTVHELSAKIESSSNQGTKSALDLNARLLAEIAYIQVQSLKLQALMSQQNAQNAADDIWAESERSRFNQLPDEQHKGKL